MIISHNGASGDYPGSTDLAYQKAIDDGADIIDCTVQMSQDGVAFCSSNIDLTSTTTALATFVDRSSSVPEIQSANGIFSFDLTWSEVESLRRNLLKLKPIFPACLIYKYTYLCTTNLQLLLKFLSKKVAC